MFSAVARTGEPAGLGGTMIRETATGDAHSIVRRERHGDWILSIVSETVADRPRQRCTISHVQFGLETRKPILSIELYPEKRGLRGTLVLPAGLRRENGVVLEGDEAASGLAQPFRAEFPLGCAVDLDLDAAMIASLRRDRNLHVRATADNTGREVIFTIPLNGFSATLRRAFSIADPSVGTRARRSSRIAHYGNSMKS